MAENREFWKFVADTAAEVAAWPRWMLGERETSTEYWERKSRMSISNVELQAMLDRLIALRDTQAAYPLTVGGVRSVIRELLAARKAISQYTDLHEDCEHKKDCPCSMCRYLAKYGETPGVSDG